eukprot:2901866-Prymnesium_polylepis.1
MRASRAGWLAEGQRCAIAVSSSPKSRFYTSQNCWKKFRGASVPGPQLKGETRLTRTNRCTWAVAHLLPKACACACACACTRAVAAFLGYQGSRARGSEAANHIPSAPLLVR